MKYIFNNSVMGKRISHARREQNLTQSEVAEVLGVSYQAVSSWENGLTCPDISKLVELSQLLKISLDHLLGDEETSISVQKVFNQEDISESELELVAPIIKPKDLERIVEPMDFGSLDIESMVSLAPHLSTDKLNNWVYNYQGDKKEMVSLAPFMSDDALSFVSESLNFNEVLSFVPFLNDTDLDKLVDRLAPFKDNMKHVLNLAPFLGNESLRKITEGMSLKEVISFVPFLADEDLDQLLQDALNRDDLEGLVSLAPYASSEMLTKIFNEEVSKGNIKRVTGLIPFLDL